MVAIVIKSNLECRLFRIKEVERRKVISHQKSQASGYYSASNLDDRGPVS